MSFQVKTGVFHTFYHFCLTINVKNQAEAWFLKLTKSLRFKLILQN